MYKLSMFDIIVKDKNGNILITNTLSNAFVRITNCHETDCLLNSILNSSSAQHLSDLQIIVPSDFDETIRIEQLYREEVINRDRLDLVLLTTNACNFNCRYCFQHKNVNRLNSKQYDGIIRFIEDRIERYRNVRVRWFGGEPTLEIDSILSFSRRMKALCAEHRKSYGASMTTNGYLLDPETFVRLFEGNVVSYQISLDGTQEIHDYNRPLKNGHGSFRKILNNLTEIRDKVPFRMFNIAIRINFTKDTIQHADQIIELYRKEFADDPRFLFTFMPVFDWSTSIDDIERARLIEQDLIQHQELLDLMKANAGKIRFDLWRELLKGSNNCWAGTPHGFAINGNGQILKCDFKLDGFDANVVGMVSPEDGTVFFSQDKNSKWIFNSPLPECYHCSVFPICLSTMCGAARIEGKMNEKCEREKSILENYLEIESYSKQSVFEDVVL